VQNVQISERTKFAYENEDNRMSLEELRRAMSTPLGRERIVNTLERSLQEFPGSDGYWKSRRAELLELTRQKGKPTVFFTMSLADMHNPTLLEALGIPYDAEIATRVKAMNESAGLVDEYFIQFADCVVNKMFKTLFNAKWLWWRVEYQGRGAPHIHGLASVGELDCEPDSNILIIAKVAQLRLQGKPLPHGLKQPIIAAVAAAEAAGTLGELVAEGPAAESRICVRTDAVLCGINPVIEDDLTHLFSLKTQLATLKRTSAVLENGISAKEAEVSAEVRRLAIAIKSRNVATLEQFKKDAGGFDVLTHALTTVDFSTADVATRLILRVLIHECQKSYCFRLRKDGKGRETSCRFHFPAPIEERTRVEVVFPTSDKGEVEINLIHRRNDPQMSPYNLPFLLMAGANVDFKVIIDYNAALSYILKYASKPEHTASSVATWIFDAVSRSVPRASLPENKTAERIFNRLESGEFASALSFLVALAKAVHHARTVATSEACRILRGGKLFHCTHSFDRVPSNLLSLFVAFDDEDEQAEEGAEGAVGAPPAAPRPRSSAWMEYGARDLRRRDPAFTQLQLLFPNSADLLALSANDFFIKIRVTHGAEPRTRFVLRAENSVVIFNNYLATKTRPSQESDDYYVYMRYFLTRHQPWLGVSPGWSFAFDMLNSGLSPEDIGLDGRMVGADIRARTLPAKPFNLDAKPLADNKRVQARFWTRAASFHLENDAVFKAKFDELSITSQRRTHISGLVDRVGGLNEHPDGEGEGRAAEEVEADAEIGRGDEGDEAPLSFPRNRLVPRSEEGRVEAAGALLGEVLRNDPAAYARIIDLLPEFLVETKKSNGVAAAEFDFEEVKDLNLNQHQAIAVESVIAKVRQLEDTGAKGISRMLILGTAGSGKSVVIKTLLNHFGSALALSSGHTGFVAFAIQGMTLHSLHGLTPKTSLASAKAPTDSVGRKFRARFNGKKILIIDEVSLIGTSFQTLMTARLETIRSNTSLQPPLLVVYFGDFRQLPPVLDSPLYSNPVFTSMPVGLLATSQRQADPRMKLMLQNLARGRCDADDARYIYENCASSQQIDRYNRFMAADVTQLCSTNVQVDEFNMKKLIEVLNRTPGLRAVEMATPQASRKDDFMCLAIGAKVMFEINLSVAHGITNGTGGTVEAILFASNATPNKDLPAAVLVRPDAGQDVGWIEAVRNEGLLLDPRFDVLKGLIPAIPMSGDGDRDRGSRKDYIPLRLKWAITIHKSQGMTMTQAIIAPSKTFYDCQLASVAMSRVKTIAGIVLTDAFQEDYICGQLNSSYKPEIDESYAKYFDRNDFISKEIRRRRAITAGVAKAAALEGRKRRGDLHA